MPETFLYAPEIEQSLVALCFHAPERIALVYRELDPKVHILAEHLRQILEAIDLAYRELGERDFASVIQTLRELGHLEACGGVAGVNAVLCEYQYGFSSPEGEEEVFRHYIDMLKTYAVNRRLSPPQPVYRFTGGRGTLSRNKIKTKDSEPDMTGYAKTAGKWYKAAAWFRGDQIEFSLVPDDQ